MDVSTVGEEKFQTTDTVKRFRKACCLFISQQAFADKERWSNEPPYLSLCQNDVSKLMRDITDRASMLVERVEYLDSALSMLVIPVNKMVYNNPHPFDGHSQIRVMNALERYRLVHNESFFKYHFTPTEFQTVVEDLTRKEKQLMAKARLESKKLMGQGGASAFRPVTQPKVAGTSASSTTPLAECMPYPSYVNRVIQLLSREKKFGDAFLSFEMSQYSKLKAALEARWGIKWMKRFERFLQEAYQSYQSIYAVDRPKSSFHCKNIQEDAKQHLANFRFCFQSKFGQESLL